MAGFLEPAQPMRVIPGMFSGGIRLAILELFL
jgi:hypothetical protein